MTGQKYLIVDLCHFDQFGVIFDVNYDINTLHWPVIKATHEWTS